MVPSHLGSCAVHRPGHDCLRRCSHTYRFRAYNDGHYLDTELSVPAKGFSWSFTAGPANIVNTMHLTGRGEWYEVTEAAVGGNPPHRIVDMLLQRQPR
jgi:hypothetical protein